VDAHALGCGADLFVIADVGTKAQGGSAGMFDFELAEIQFSFAAGEKSNAGTFGREPDRQTFSNTSARTGDQDGNTF
jgi:hypothetical protein